MSVQKVKRGNPHKRSKKDCCAQKNACRATVSVIRGMTSEDRFFRVLSVGNSKEAPWWFSGIRKASGHEDFNGRDFFIQTKLGVEIPIDVKSSIHYVVKKFESWERQKSVLVAVTPQMTDEDVRIITFKRSEKYLVNFLRRNRLVALCYVFSGL